VAAFSDGGIAIIITITILELEFPEKDDIVALTPFPKFELRFQFRLYRYLLKQSPPFFSDDKTSQGGHAFD
jgi:uncharacterized membrane protein